MKPRNALRSVGIITVPPEDFGYQSGTIATDMPKDNVGGLREKARAKTIPHVQAEANAARDGPKAKVWVAKACLAIARQ